MYSELHLHTSHGSLLDSIIRIEDLVIRAGECNLNAVAMTDHGTMHSTINFYKAFKNAGKIAIGKLGKKKYKIDAKDLSAILKEIPDYSDFVFTIMNSTILQEYSKKYPDLFDDALKCSLVKPIIGMEAYECDNINIKDKEDVRYHLILLAKDNEGLEALYKLSSISFLKGFYYKPRLDIDTIAPYAEHLIVMSACLGGRLAKLVAVEEWDLAKQWLEYYKSIFPNFYIEIQHHNTPDQITVNKRLESLSIMTDTPMTCTSDAHFLYEADMNAQAAFVSIGQSREVGETYTDCYVKDEKKIKQILSDQGLHPVTIEESIKNTNIVADMCNVSIDLNLPNQMPAVKVPENFLDSQVYFRHLVNEGYKKRYNDSKSYTKEVALERLRTEYDVLKFQGYIDYFLLLKQLVDEARERNIPLGFSRGSGGNCYTLYTLGVTEVDSIRWDLDFSRFATKGRKSVADYDMDISKRRRKDMIDIAREQFNVSQEPLETRVASICTFNSLSTKVALRDLGKVLFDMAESERKLIESGELTESKHSKYCMLDYVTRDEVAKMIPVIQDVDEFGQEIDKEVALAEAIEDNAKLKEYQKKFPLWFELVLKLEGLPKSLGTHAAGVVITPQEITKYAPLCMNTDKEPMIQYEMHNILDDLHLVKMDFLGLKTVDVIDDSLKLAGLTWEDIDLEKLDLDDAKVYTNTYKGGHCNGVFQMESLEATDMCVEAKCNGIQDVIAINAANRPGTKEFFPIYIKNKLHPEAMQLIHEDLRPIVSVTHGILLYQEQVLNVFRMANFPELEVDTARRAIGKKEAKTMASLKQKMFDETIDEHRYGLIQKDWTEEQIQMLWDVVEKQASYSFNAGHSTAYGLLSYVTAYIKTYHPIQFMTALLNSEEGNYAQISKYIHECNRLKINVLEPDINISQEKFTIDNEVILFGLGMIKGLGDAATNKIMNGRPYESFEDFLIRSHGNITVTEALIKSGSFHQFSTNKEELLHRLCKWLYDDLQYKDRKNFSNKELAEIGFDISQYQRGEVIKIPADTKQELIQKANVIRKTEYDKKNCLRYDNFELEFNTKYLVGDEADFQMQTMSMYLTVNPFQSILNAERINTKLKPFKEMPQGLGIVIGTIIEVKRKATKKEGKIYAFTNVLNHIGEMIEVTVGSIAYGTNQAAVKKGNRVILQGKKEGMRFFVEEIKTVSEWESCILDNKKG